jgi:hypothetical protein
MGQNSEMISTVFDLMMSARVHLPRATANPLGV